VLLYLATVLNRPFIWWIGAYFGPI